MGRAVNLVRLYRLRVQPQEEPLRLPKALDLERDGLQLPLDAGEMLALQGELLRWMR